MSLENTRISLVRALREWRSALQQVERALDDHPVADPTDPGQDRLAIMDDLADSVLEVIGRIEDAMTALERVNTARSGSIVLDLWRTTLPMVQATVHLAVTTFLTRVTPVDHDLELRRIGRLRGPEWSSWSKVVRQGLSTSVPALIAVHHALGESWIELGGRVSATPGVQQLVTIYQTGRSGDPATIQASESANL